MMIRKLMAGSAMVALLSTGAITIAQAQTEPAQDPIATETAAPAPEATAPVSELAASEQVLTPAQPTLATVYIGKSVYSSQDPQSDNIGDVNDLIVGEDGAITHAVVGVGGFLGIGEKDVAVPFDELQVVDMEGDLRLIYASTREQLEAAPALDRSAFIAPEVAVTAAAPIVADDTTAPADETAMAPTETAPADETMVPANQDMASETAVEPAPAEQTAVTETAPADESTMAPAEEETAATELAPAEDATTLPATGEDVVAAGEETAPLIGSAEGFLAYNVDQIRASEFIGKAVYSGEDSIGEVSDVIMTDDGQTRAALIDVGGFLGIGEKTVALPFQDLQIVTSADNADDVQVTVAMSKEQLEQLPAYEAPETAVVRPVEGMAPADGAMAPQSTDDVATAPVDPTVDPTLPADQTAEAPATDTNIVTGSVPATGDYALATQDLSADDLIGTTVYSQEDSNVGEVSDVIFDKTGTIEAVLVDIGGFLGMGEKPVALDFDSLNVRRDENGVLIAMVDFSKDQLDQAPTYEEAAPMIEETAPASDMTTGETVPAQ